MLVFYDNNPLNAELNPICHLLAVLETHHILHVSRIRDNTFNCKWAVTPWQWLLCMYEDESNANLKYVFSRNLLNTKGIQ